MVTKTVKVPLRKSGQKHRFDPVELTIQAGDTVTWENDDTSLHTVTPEDGSAFPEGTLGKKGATYSYQFDSEGEYPYVCVVHSSMTGKIVVVAAAK